MNRSNEYTFDKDVVPAARAFGAAIAASRSISLMLATVDTVDEEARTIDTIVGDKAIRDISLEVIPNGGSSIILVPEIGSVVVLGFIEGFIEMPFIVKHTKVKTFILFNNQTEESKITVNNDSIEIVRGSSIWKIENERISLSGDLIELNGGENGGLPLVTELTDSLNAFVNEVSSFVSTFNSHTHTVTGSSATGGPVTGATGSPTSPAQSPSNFNAGDYTNEIVTQ